MLYKNLYNETPDLVAYLKILPQNAYNKSNNTYEEELTSQYKTSGITNASETIPLLGKLNETIDLEKSIENLISNIIQADKNILEAKFPISPYKISKTDSAKACDFCGYADVCYKTKEDRRMIKKHE
jgi:ATP-dependent helicase/DNAse subunit B